MYNVIYEGSKTICLVVFNFIVVLYERPIFHDPRNNCRKKTELCNNNAYVRGELFNMTRVVRQRTSLILFYKLYYVFSFWISDIFFQFVPRAKIFRTQTFSDLASPLFMTHVVTTTFQRKKKMEWVSSQCCLVSLFLHHNSQWLVAEKLQKAPIL